ncbi:MULTISPECIES: hypothetical protein [Aliivibrio]|jgi:phosphoglycerol transferase MdoB-like AlkP superfamily enzyme|uniref:Uncharacterized protein n=3 Tax=Aliivibrio TaxID=511678 RepID=A0A1B9NV34_ALILO|nr:MULTISPECIES: hypothetical protein [Aliivibrio]AZL83866.1 hypothetical protein EIJ81_03565 [Aliivibrio salmonicida]MBB1314447.1 hypothetical protein [Aliivibrio sp. SR45-2]OCH17885.1 hypothetical protein A6E04_17950 [Aliivibrio logei]OEF10138.1 hypothetical protein A1Q5_13395 [Aliivibrio logei 5S-186]CAQ78103.1 membrane protein [Aliivibrio salmonicida LFI1238]
MNKRFWLHLGTAIGLFGFFFIAAFVFHIYEVFYFFSFLAYGVLIFNLLSAIVYADQWFHYVLCSVLLIILGTFASIDVLSARDELLTNWIEAEWLGLTVKNSDDYIQVILILINIFTGSLAANTLFYGLCKKNSTVK